jgi:hypothetical protein
MRLLPSFLLIVAVGLALAGRAAAADFPKGTFVLTTKDKAEWAVSFDGKGKFTVTRDGEEAVKGSYKATADELEITDEDGPLASKGEAKTATYKWKLDGKKLTFTKVKDEAGGRAAVVTAGPWTKKE